MDFNGERNNPKKAQTGLQKFKAKLLNSKGDNQNEDGAYKIDKIFTRYKLDRLICIKLVKPTKTRY